ncbi:pyridoxamine 5'-phosphate oxidase family protein [Streptomyces sp. BE20]|uniref:pyridoxamine 5'-phosphate oxidase family protein n=1 Tax=Streptomycetaceae TaxID=2062 RepID=UPI002E77BA9B|nr:MULTISPECIES: pyridoxamine 5'-phosphate oxidase family protein [unclassified Streptomyces]MED7949516.1 pyridoxamine 5'-phosphate oxidase family protein [Streptomyces sp. BE303]MEE1824492.1 pyridoxamine 5'-phosphate oxidase family protein [Streptomyces sp. BE20]
MDRDDQLEALTEAACLRLLSTVPVGRVVYTEHALPAVLPVSFDVTPDGRLLLAVRRGSATARCLDGTVVAFQADRLDPVTRTGWSVLVHGRADLVREPEQVRRALRSGLRPWVGDSDPLFVSLVPELVSGRRLLRSGRSVQRS